MGQKGEIEDRPLPISVNHDPTDLIMLHACLELLPNLSPAQNTGIFVFFFFFFCGGDRPEYIVSACRKSTTLRAKRRIL